MHAYVHLFVTLFPQYLLTRFDGLSPTANFGQISRLGFKVKGQGHCMDKCARLCLWYWCDQDNLLLAANDFSQR